MAPLVPVVAAPLLSFGAKVAIFLAVSIALFGGGYYLGHRNAVNAQKAKIVDRIIVQTKYLPQETKVIHDRVVQVKTVHDKVYINVAKVVHDNRVCDVPAAGVSLLNSARALPTGK
jgi:hypothetical protein